MIYQIKKNVGASPDAVSVISAIGEFVCNVSVLGDGYYLFNKQGLQIAQIVFKDAGAIMSIARTKPVFPGSLKISRLGKDEYVISANQVGAEDDQYLENIKGKKSENYSIWGTPSEYNYDIYCGNKLAANVLISATEPATMKINMGLDGNLLNVIMIALAVDKFNS